MFINILFRGAQAFFILQSGVQFFLPYHWRWYYVILYNLSSCFMIHMLSRMRYLNSSTSSLELSCVMFHLKPSLRIVAIYGAHKWPKFFIYPLGEINFSSPCWCQFNLLFQLVAEFHLKFRDVFHKPTTSLFVPLLVFQQLRYNLLGRVLSKIICGRSWHFLLRPFIPTI